MADGRGGFKDLTGRRFGRIEVLGVVERPARRIKYFCRCDCGVEKQITGQSLAAGHVNSCGCLSIEMLVERSKVNNVSHGHVQAGKGSPEYKTWRAWSSMRERCLNANHHAFDRYGGRGIMPCAGLDDYEAFVSVMGVRPNDKLSLDRRDNDAGYHCGQCDECRANGWQRNIFWATKSEQNNNRVACSYLELQGRRMTLMQWSKETGISHSNLSRRYRAGKSAEEILAPVKKYRPRAKG